MSVIDLDPLLQEILPEAPSGETDLETDAAFIELGIKIDKLTSTSESIMKQAAQTEVPFNWKKIQNDAVELLTRTHDLRVSMHLTQALVHNEGVFGLCDGLDLLRGFIDQYWDTLYPQLDPNDDNDPTWRINILESLSNYDIMIRPLTQVTLVSCPGIGRFTLRDIHISTGKITLSDDKETKAISPSAIEAAFQNCDIDTLRATLDATESCLKRLDDLREILKEKVGETRAPDFKTLRNTLKEINAIFAEQAGKRNDSTLPDPEDIHETESSNEPGATRPAHSGFHKTGMPVEAINNRQDIVRILKDICTYYSKNEPSSPVPLLLERAIRLVEKNFVEIMKDLAPDSVSQIQLISGKAVENTG